ncbi:NAD(P)-dependent oxidoreductase [Micromonospora cathayae]|uniref:NAD(P)H-binding protein n=1 Tax=Micromonospora cathayae TaxID=3028804 RepID=A0ABY7ZRX8_9ACTN|nr:NAD(P)H-binding protein [Micromonospora sp. HUAS 3]WDZ84609.1 NAD(P)H-binding protein [Micromonospora sp. HUAS 3]
MDGIVVFGAGGRAGRAVTGEAVRRGHPVTAVVRDPNRYPGLAAPGVTLLAGDVTDPAATARIVPGHLGAVAAVTPASDPGALAALDRFDDGFYVRAVDALLAGAGVPRVVLIGLFATLLDGTGRRVLDDPAVFPASLRAFALAHDAGLDRLRAARTPVDWLVLTPPAMLDPAGPRTGRYRVGGDTVPTDGSGPLSYADLAVATLDEIESPTRHRTRVAVYA